MSIKASLEKINRLAANIGRTVRIMEVCGTHTMAAFRTGIRSLLPKNLCLISGPGCPVCVSTNGFIDKAIALSRMRSVTVSAFGDMVRVPGTQSSLEKARAEGADLRVVYSQSDALELAGQNPSRKTVFLGVGFETTAPATAWTIKTAAARGLLNYHVLCSHKTMPMAMKAIVSSPDLRIDGLLCPGHVSIITGAKIYEFISRDFQVPCVVAGFEAADILEALSMLLTQIAGKKAEVGIQYKRCVNWEGNEKALSIMNEVFEPEDADWRGFGIIPQSGLKIRGEFSGHDAEKLLDGVPLPESHENPDCRCGDIVRGAATPDQCPLFGKACAPQSPVGACMVSSEGTCAAYYKYGKLKGIRQ